MQKGQLEQQKTIPLHTGEMRKTSQFSLAKRRFSLLGALLLVLLVGGGLALAGSRIRAFANNTPTGSLIPPAATQTMPAWIISENAIHLLEQHGASSSFISSLFNNAQTSIILSSSQQLPSYLNKAVVIQSFISYADIQHAFATKGFIKQQTKIILYDLENEHWTFTCKVPICLPPTADEIAHPVQYTQLATSIVQGHGLHLMVVPGMDLGASSHGTIPPLPQSFYNFEAKGFFAMAKYAESFQLQLENIEANESLYATLAKQGREDVEHAHPGIPFFLQLSASASGSKPTAKELLADYQATRGLVTGFALTIPDSSTVCPTCGSPQPGVMFSFLKDIAPH